MAPAISFGHFNIVGGSVQEDGPYVGVVEDRTPAEAVGDLYLTLEPAQVGSEALCPDLLTLISGQFGWPQYSLTGNLLQALRAAQEHLHAWNKSALPDRQAAVGATCLAVSGNQAYLAQVGPGLAYFRHDGLLRRFQAIEREGRAPLGTTIGCSPDFSHFELSQGDTILLVASRFATLVDDQTVDLLLSLAPSEALPEIYKLSRQQLEFSALYLAVTGDLRPPRPLDADDAHPSTRPPNGGYHAPDRGFRASQPRLRAPDEGFRGPVSASGSRLVGTADAFESAAIDDGEAFRGPGMQLVVLPQGNNPPPGWFAKRRELERLTERRSINLPRPALYTVAALLALTVAGWFGLPHLLQTGRQDRYASLIADATRQESAAASAQGAPQKRGLLDRAQADLVEARTLRPSDPRQTSLDSNLTREVQALNQVRQPSSIQTVTDLSTTLVAARSVTEIAAAGEVFVLDSSTGRVYAFNPSGQSSEQSSGDAAVFQSGQNVESISAGQAEHIAASPGSGSQPGSVYILDSNRRLFELDASGTLQAIGLEGANTWKSATAIAASGGSLYVLDSMGNQVWRFDGSGHGFTTPPVPLLSKADLHDATQISIAGDVYLGTANGVLERIQGSRLQPVKTNGIDQALVGPQPPILDSGSGLDLIADPGNERIVVVDGNGTYQYQYAGGDLLGLRAIAVDQTSGILYALSGQKIISTVLH